MWVFVPGAVGAGGTPTMYYFFGGREIKELIRKYGEIVKFGDLTTQSGWLYTTPIGVHWEDICEFWKNQKERDSGSECEDIRKMYEEGKIDTIWVDGSGFEEGRERDVSEERMRTVQEENWGKEIRFDLNAKGDETLNEKWNGIREKIRKYLGEQNGHNLKKGRKCYKRDKKGIVFNWFQGWINSCIRRESNGGNKERVLFEKTAWLIASNAMSIMDSALRISLTKNDLAIRFVTREGKIKEIFRLGWKNGTERETWDGLVVRGEWIKEFGYAHKKNDKNLRWGEKVKTGKFGWNPESEEKRKIAFE
ncbi:hypothetical protein PRV_00165 [Mycoplasma parvum str. Indiana]|uniref:Uncharacterized protein n=1 Tax=Mycoplasma parvum str. Indiana TaxID=1403316 RepID=U5NF10_9MOLU|nr:hypothetical protein PRV_00165 [Mycoplasma parvum str. Indiana]